MNVVRSVDLCLKFSSKLCKKSPQKPFLWFQRNKTNFKFRSQKDGSKPSEAVDYSLHLKPKELWKPFLFSVTFTCGSFGCATICEYEIARRNANKSTLEWLVPRSQAKNQTLRNELNIWWNNLRDAEKAFVGIVFLNLCVYVAWKVPAFQRTLTNYFTCHTSRQYVYSQMLLSVFSHYSIVHLGINMYVLSSFSSALSRNLKGEEFVAFYLSAGVFSSFFSQCLKVMTGVTRASVGASGAILGVFALLASLHPQSHIGIVFVPNISFTAENGLLGIMALDFIGMVMRWKVFDHASHFGGSLFGVWYTKWGRTVLWNNRVKVAQKWHDFRTKR